MARQALAEEGGREQRSEDRHQLQRHPSRVGTNLAHAAVPEDVGHDRREQRDVGEARQALAGELQARAGPELQSIERQQ